MKLKTLMIIKAVVCLSLGVPILAMPVFFYSLFGIDINPGGAFAAREYGGGAIATGQAAAASQRRGYNGPPHGR